MSLLPRAIAFSRIIQFQIRQCVLTLHSFDIKHKHKYLESGLQLAQYRSKSIKHVEPKYEAYFDDVVGSLNKPKTVIIDVRNPDEVQSTGQIPSSINIPLDTLQKVLTNMSEEELKNHFNRSKPSQADQLIFYCKSGKRASKALEAALTLGYSKSKKYSGSWDEWSSRKKM